MVQTLTIVNVASAFTSVELALFALWPFGQSERCPLIPHTLCLCAR